MQPHNQAFKRLHQRDRAHDVAHSTASGLGSIALQSYRLILMALLVGGCVSRPATPRPALDRVSIKAQSGDAFAFNQTPELWIGPQWTYDGLEPVSFEVWASTNLVDWVLATNTIARQVLFPPKACEFYRVRTKDDLGQVSDWATVPARE